MSDLSTYINIKDTEQADPATAKVCQKDPSHGRLSVHGTGGALVCLNRVNAKGEKLKLCDYAEPLGNG